MSAHTPGPYEIIAPHRTGGLLGDAGDRGIVAAGRLIAETYARDQYGASLPADVNAHLMAAAPDLLAALRQCAAVVAGETMHKGGLVSALEAARAAIAKATGSEVPA